MSITLRKRKEALAPRRRECYPVRMIKAALLSALLTSTQLLAAPTTVATRAINTLGIELLARTSKPDQNALLSPYSIQSALAMTYAGADGLTRDEMMKVLHYPTNDAELHDSFATLSKALDTVMKQSSAQSDYWKKNGNQRDPITLTVANRLFGQSGYDFRPSFLDVVREKYSAALEPVDFVRNPSGTTQHINRWVEEQTHQRIRNVVPETLDPLTRLVLVNAIYFKAPWAEPFHESSTRPEPFHLRDETTAYVPTMVHLGHHAYFVRDGYSVIILSYTDPAIQFLILLPKKADGLPALEARLSEILLSSPTNANSRSILLHLPKFKIEPASISLSSTLQSFGVKSAFSPATANFDRMTPRRTDGSLFIRDVFHKAFMDVNEEGTEAAAATVVDMPMGGVESDIVEIRVDHPFLFAIQQRPSGACLFLGRMVDPR